MPASRGRFGGLLLALVQDITRRRRGVHFAIGQILAESPSLNEATPRILQTVGETLDWEIGAMWIADSTQCAAVPQGLA